MGTDAGAAAVIMCHCACGPERSTVSDGRRGPAARELHPLGICGCTGLNLGRRKDSLSFSTIKSSFESLTRGLFQFGSRKALQKEQGYLGKQFEVDWARRR